jgi:hypothetical protein
MYTELARIDAKGQVTQPVTPREILSPMAVRNGITSFQIVVSAPDDKPWQLYVAQNPENYFGVTLYREMGDQLEKTAEPVKGMGTQVFWLDLRESSGQPGDHEERIKVEPQLNIDNDWVIYPIEVRVMETMAPDPPAGGWPAGGAAPEQVMRDFVCNTKTAAGAAGGGTTMAHLRFRNAQQDVAMAVRVPKAALASQVGAHLGACDAAPPAGNPERYLRLRDFLSRGQ